MDPVAQVRLQGAKTLLETSDIALSEIALASGFANQSHFTVAFRKRFGRPPGRHRRLARAS